MSTLSLSPYFSIWFTIAHTDANNFQFWIKFNLNGDKIGYNANRNEVKCQHWDVYRSAVMKVNQFYTRCVNVWWCVYARVSYICTSVRINDNVISFWMIQKHSSFYEASLKTRWQILSLATGPSTSTFHNLINSNQRTFTTLYVSFVHCTLHIEHLAHCI